MKMKNIEIVQVLNILTGADLGDFRVKDKLSIIRFKKALMGLYESYYEVLKELESKYFTEERTYDVEKEDGTKDKCLKQEYVEDYITERDELYNAEADIVCPAFNTDDIPESIPMSLLEILEPMIQ